MAQHLWEVNAGVVLQVAGACFLLGKVASIISIFALSFLGMPPTALAVCVHPAGQVEDCCKLRVNLRVACMRLRGDG